MRILHVEHHADEPFARSAASLSANLSSFRARILSNSARREAWSEGRLYNHSSVFLNSNLSNAESPYPHGPLLRRKYVVLVLREQH